MLEFLEWEIRRLQPYMSRDTYDDVMNELVKQIRLGNPKGWRILADAKVMTHDKFEEYTRGKERPMFQWEKPVPEKPTIFTTKKTVNPDFFKKQ